jgi:hypothetical protein
MPEGMASVRFRPELQHVEMMKRALRFLASASWPILIAGCAAISMLAVPAVLTATAWHDRQQSASQNDFHRLAAERAREWMRDAGTPGRPSVGEANPGERDIYTKLIDEDLAKSPGARRFAEPEHGNELLLKKALGTSVAAFVALVMIVALLRAFAAEAHPGWKRLTIISPTAGLLAGFWTGWDEYGEMDGEVVAYALGGALLCFALFVFGRRIAVWVLEGFGRAAQPPEPVQQTQQVLPAPIAASEPPKVSALRVGNRVAVIATVFVVLLIHFMTGPERALETTISAVFTVLGIVVIVYVFRRISEAIDYWRG